jgi:polyphosphate kinase
MNTDAFINRELSWLEFNRRVLEEAQDPSVPVLERVKFLAIFSSNLDEFFMVRVATLKRRIRSGEPAGGPDGLTPAETMAAVAARLHELVDHQHTCFLEEIQPLLAAEGILLLRPKETSEEQQRFLEDYFRRTLLPVLTPLAVDHGHPFPYLGNRSLCLVASVRPSAPSALPHSALSVVHIPSQVLPRFIALPDPAGRHIFMLLEDVIRLHLPTVYNGYEILSSHAIRVTRDADLQPPGRPDDLLASIEESLRERRLGTAVRLQYDADLPPDILGRLLDELELSPEDLYEGEGFTAFSDLFQLYAALDVPRLKDRPLPPHPVRAFESAADIWSAIRARDVLVHHPYHSFDAVTRFVREAAIDPKVLAIKMTFYRVSPASPIAHALRAAVENGKEVAVLVELQARFDEEANIGWARALEEVGAHVVYGVAGFKTHCKACLVVRQEADGIRRYCHLATGNYNARTGGVYEDLGLFTSRESFGEDLTELFNLLTGYTRPHGFHHLLLAPSDLREGLVERIRREASHARAGRPARIIAKMNGLADHSLIEELYEASGAGVRIDLIVRGICCLRPEVPGLSDNIRVISIVDRFLEHARIFYFENAGELEYLLASADWMPRNLDRRVEIAFPVLDPGLQAKVREVLEIQLADTVKARRILPDGRSVRIHGDGQPALRAQERLYEASGPGGILT